MRDLLAVGGRKAVEIDHPASSPPRSGPSAAAPVTNPSRAALEGRSEPRENVRENETIFTSRIRPGFPLSAHRVFSSRGAILDGLRSIGEDRSGRCRHFRQHLHALPASAAASQPGAVDLADRDPTVGVRRRAPFPKDLPDDPTKRQDRPVSRAVAPDFERCAEAMLPIVGRLYRERGVIITCYGNSLVNKIPVEIIQHHSFASRGGGQRSITVQDTLPILSRRERHRPRARPNRHRQLPHPLPATRATGAISPSLRAIELASVCDGQDAPCSRSPRTSCSTASAASAAWWPASWWARPAAATASASRPSWCARAATTISPSAPACCGATRSTAPSAAASTATRRRTRSSPTAT